MRKASARPSKAVAVGYRQISAALEDAIRSGRYLPGSSFPSELELAESFQVSRLTIRRALQRLSDEGLITRHPGIGSFVSAHALPPVVSPLEHAHRQLLDLTKNAEISYLSRTPVQMSPAMRKLFGPDPRNLMDEFVTVRSVRRTPIAYIVSDLPAWAGALVPNDEFRGFLRITEALESHGVIAQRLRQSVGALAADPEIAARLSVEAGSPILRFTRTAYDAQGRAFSHVRSHFRGDSYEYDMEFISGGLTGT